MTLGYSGLRRRTQERDRSLREKVMSLDEAAALVPDGSSVGIGGSTLSRTPMAMIWALIRAGRRDLVCARGISSSEGELLFAAGASRHLVASWFSLGIVWGVSRIMRLYTEFEPGTLRGVEPSGDGAALSRRGDGRAVSADALDAGL